jgi:tripartite-type tricarboxylate transporter receptor subunit TctC
MRRRLGAALVGLMAAAMSFAAEAQTFPSRPVTLIVPWPAGGTTDVVMRALATASEKHLGQSIVIDNRGGAAGTLGPAHMAASAKPEVGIDLVSNSPFGIAGPAGMDRAVVAALHDAFKKGMQEASYIAAMERFDQEPFYLGSDDYRAYALTQTAEEKRLIEELGLKAE